MSTTVHQLFLLFLQTASDSELTFTYNSVLIHATGSTHFLADQDVHYFRHILSGRHTTTTTEIFNLLDGLTED